MKSKQIRSLVMLFLNLLKKDMRVYFKDIYRGDLLDNIIWSGTFIFTMTYVLPHIGLSANYGPFFAVSMIVSVAFWDTWNTATQLIADLDGNRIIEYYLTLPISATLYFIKKLCYFAVRAGVLSGSIALMAKIMLWDLWDLSHIVVHKTIIIFICAMFFCAVISLTTASMVKNINNLGHISIRTLFPMFSLGGTQCSWVTLYSLSPLFAYLSLINPLLYVTEGMHAAMLGPFGYLQFWICVMMTLFFTCALGAWSIHRMKRRLDCV